MVIARCVCAMACAWLQDILSTAGTAPHTYTTLPTHIAGRRKHCKCLVVRTYIDLLCVTLLDLQAAGLHPMLP